VGNDVPTVGATASDPIQSNRTITTVLYRKTGLELTIVPNINAQGLVVMEIKQRISNTVPGSSGVSGAPTFFDRSVNTEVVARSGQSILLAGLISESGSLSSDGIPWVRKLPLLGAAFRSDSKKREKTELVLMITPRVIDTPEEWDYVRRGLESALQYLQPVSSAVAQPESKTPPKSSAVAKPDSGPEQNRSE
jgi:general secretion pathway protein D